MSALGSVVLRTFRLVYRLSPAKIGLTRVALLLRRFAHGENAPRRTKLGSPSFIAEVDLRDRIQYLMYARGCHEPETEKVFRRELGSGFSFADIGANVGYFSLLAAASDPRAAIFSFEPLPRNAELFRKNVALNGFRNVRVEEAAVSDREGWAELETPDPIAESGWNKVLPADGHAANGAQRLRVRLISLDRELERLQVPGLSFLKIDVEGHELSVLKGAKGTLSASGPRKVLIEINEECLVAQGSSGAEVHGFLSSLGYRCHRIERDGALVAVGQPDPRHRIQNYFYSKE